LYDENNNCIENPIVCYRGVANEKKLRFTGVFGIEQMKNNGLVGPYYYFTTYNKAIEEGCWSIDNEFKNEPGGIVRFALFTSSMKVILNYQEDEIDVSELKKQLLQKNNNTIESQIMRITDYDGNWTENFNSVYIGKLELDNGEILNDAPYWVVKDYSQQLPLSFHYIDKRTLENKLNNEYYIK
jgi:hypothetical protein